MPGIQYISCAGAVAPRDCSDLDFEGTWDRGGSDCQRYRVTEVRGAKAPYVVSLNGSQVNFPYSVDTGVEGDVLVEIVDADGCSVVRRESNTLDISKPLWGYQAGSTARAPNIDGGSASHGDATASPRTDVTATFIAPGGGLTSNSWAGWWSNRVLVRQTGNGLAKATLGTETNPIAFDPCASSIEWGYRVAEGTGLEGDDYIRAYLYWYDGDGGLLSSEQIGNHTDDFGNLIRSGAASIPADAVAVMMRFDIQSDHNENIWIDPRNGHVFLRQV